LIQGLDHVAVATRALAPAVDAYAAVLGRPMLLHQNAGDGVQLAVFELSNMALCLAAPTGAGVAAEQLTAWLHANGEGLLALGFAVPDLARAERLAARRGLSLADGASLPLQIDNAQRCLRIAEQSTFDVPIVLVERAGPTPRQRAADDAVSGLDHVVIRSPNPDRAIALYAGRLGLDLRLDRSNPDWGARLLFFRCGDLVVEVAHDLKGGISDAPDRLWGLSWRAPRIAATHARLQSAGVAVSEQRAGRRPGTKVFTVRSHTCAVPTLMLGRQDEAGA
jgi:catechol 2,3-dioxygenase-like lactoylglutathione lyase family enzyme